MKLSGGSYISVARARARARTTEEHKTDLLGADYGSSSGQEMSRSCGQRKVEHLRNSVIILKKKKNGLRTEKTSMANDRKSQKYEGPGQVILVGTMEKTEGGLERRIAAKDS